MEALSALAVVAQKAITPEGQKAIPTALLVADLERTRLDYERSRMMAEDQSVRYARSRAMEIDFHRAIERNIENELDERLDERDAALEARDAALEERDAALEARNARAESEVLSHRIMMRAIDERTEAVYDRTEALRERDALTERLDEAERANASLVRALEEQARSHQRADTEVEARHKRRR